MKFILVDDNATFIEGVSYFLENVLGHEVVGTAADGADFLEMEDARQADVVLMDINMPKLDGMSTVKQALWKWNYHKFIAVTNLVEEVFLKDLLGAGFKGCVFKDDVYKNLTKAIDLICNKNELYFPENIKIADQNAMYSKSPEFL